jgi:putative transposase
MFSTCFWGIGTSSASSPTATPLIRLVGAVLAEQHDEWAESRRCLGLDVLSKSRAVNDTPTEQEATPARH